MDQILQSPRELQLGVFTHNSLPETTDLMLCEDRSGINRVTFTIIGESHKIKVLRDGKLVLAELLACIPIDPLQGVHHHCFVDGKPHSWHTEGYQLSVWTVSNHVPVKSLPNSIQFAFPETYGVIPITRVEWEILATGIHWKTYHVYPDESGLVTVCSNSKFTFPI